MTRSLKEDRKKGVRRKLETCPGCYDSDVRRNMLPEKRCVRCRMKERSRIWILTHPEEMHARVKQHRKRKATGTLRQRDVYTGP